MIENAAEVILDIQLYFFKKPTNGKGKLPIEKYSELVDDTSNGEAVGIVGAGWLCLQQLRGLVGWLRCGARACVYCKAL